MKPHSLYLRLPPPYRVARCVSCGLQLLIPPRTLQESTDHHTASSYYRADEYDKRARSREPVFQARLDEIESSLGTSQRVRILDFGCAAGHFLRAAKAGGFSTVGVEIAPQLAQVAAQNVPCNVFSSMAEVKEAGIRANVVHSNHSLEHLTDPMEFLRGSFQVLWPGGVLAIEVPNQFSAWTEQVKILAFRVLGPRIANRLISEPVDSLHHTFFYSPKTLRRLVEQTGFRVESLSTVNPAYYKTTAISPSRRFIYKRLDRVFDRYERGRQIVLFARRKSKRAV